MRIFQSDECIVFGEPLPMPLGHRPKQAEFAQARATAGFAFQLSWQRTKGAIGYHIFRSMSVSLIRERSIDKLWSGAYANDIRHFAIGFPDVSTVVDDYGCRGASMMYYWVLAQIAGGHLSEVDGLSVGMADTSVLDRPHFLLQPGGRFVDGEPTSPSRAPPRPIANPAAPRSNTASTPARKPQMPDASDRNQTAAEPRRGPPPVVLTRYVTPGGLRFFRVPEGVDHISVYIGTEPPDADDQRAMWQDIVYDSNPLEQYRLSPNYTGFIDRLHPPDTIAYAAALAFTQDRRVRQVDLALALNIKRSATLK